MENTDQQPCLVCGVELDVSDPTKTGHLSCNDGVIYSTSGNYGSTVLDDDGTIVFVICDACLIKHRSRLRAFKTSMPRVQAIWTVVPVEELIPDKLPSNSSLKQSPLDEFITGVEEQT
jgi:hypothetical protein